MPILAVGCQTYAPAPVDLDAHARAFAERLPDAPSVTAFIATLRQRQPQAPAFNARDGIDVGEAHLLALLFHADLRRARLAAGVALAGRDHAGRWDDAAARFDLTRILESVPHPWLAAIEVGLTLPLSGLPGLERRLADAECDAALLAARAAEANVLDQLDVLFCEWSAAVRHAQLVDELIVRLQTVDQIAERLAQANEITALDARTFTLELLRREIERAHLAARAEELELKLKQMVGLTPTAAVTFVPTLAVLDRAPPPATREAALRQHHPGIAGARLAYARAERKLALAVRRQWPALSLFPGFAYDEGQHRVGLGVAAPLPLFNGNARAIAEARAERALAAETLRTALEEATQELAQAEVRLVAAAAQRQALEQRLVPLVDRQVEEGRRVIELGRLDTLLLLDGFVRAHQTKVMVLEAQLDEARATARRNAMFWPDLPESPTAEAQR